VTEINKGGRPAIGKQITVTLPGSVLDRIDEEARIAGVRRADVIRDHLTRAVEAPMSSEDVRETLRPAANLIAAYVETGGDLPGRRERFIEYQRVAGSPQKLPKLLMEIAGRLVLENAVQLQEAALDPAVVTRLADNREWRLRAQLFFAASEVLDQRNVRVGPLPGADDEEEIVLGLGAEDEDYA
jgi:hypothetical protein